MAEHGKDRYLARRERGGLEKTIRNFREQEVLRALAKADFSPGTQILDVGASDCRLAGRIKGSFPGFCITAVDTSVEALRAAGPGVADRIAADAHALPFRDDSFDALICVSTFKHLGKPQSVIDEFHRVLRTDGCLILIEPSCWVVRVGRLFGYFDRRWLPNVWGVREYRRKFCRSNFIYVRGGYFAPAPFHSALKFLPGLYQIVQLRSKPKMRDLVSTGGG